MNYRSAHPRQTISANMRELMPHELAVQGLMDVACRKQVGLMSGACIVAVQEAKDCEC